MSAEGALPLTERLLADPSLADCWRDEACAAGEHLFRQGDEGDAFYTVVDGLLEVYHSDADGRRVILARLAPGAHVGELALVDGGVRSANVLAIEASRLKVLRRGDYLRALSTSPDLRDVTIEVLGARMRRTIDYLGFVTQWARLVARGEYEGAQRAIIERAARTADANDDLFAQTFTDMIRAVRTREDELRRELDRLKIEIDQERRAQKLSEITEDAFFQSLQRSAAELRRRMRDPDR